MRSSRFKLAALSALGANPDFSQLQALDFTSERESRAFLRWLDQSGIALYLAWQLGKNGAFGTMPERLQSHLRSSLESNRARTALMLADFRKVNDALRAHRVPHAFLKGFSLTPDFCPGPEFRHQSDIDVLIPPEAMHEARTAIFACGYSGETQLLGGEVHFSTKLTRIPSAADDVYRADYQKQAELHTSIWEEVGQVALPIPASCLDRAIERRISHILFTSLTLEDALLAQLLHVFRHFLSSWVRLSWLWEIHHLLSHHVDDLPLWVAFRRRCGHDPILRNALGLVLRLTNLLFGSPIPKILGEWCIDTLPHRIHCWILEFGIPWALSDLPGSKVTLFIHKEFMRHPKLWKAYLWRRLVPLNGKARLSQSGSPGGVMAFRFAIRHRLFLAGRLAFHATSLFVLASATWRWKRALIQVSGSQAVFQASANQAV